MTYRSLSIGVPETAGQRALPFAAGLPGELSDALRALGYAGDVHVGGLTSAKLGELVHTSLGGSGVLVLHVLGHGVQAVSDALYVLGSDGARHHAGEVAGWLSDLENVPDRPLTLLLLDLCHAGAMARLPWQLGNADGSARAWVLAACAEDEQAYDGRFTRAVVNVLGALADGTLGVDPSVRHVPLQTVGRAVLREVNRLRGRGYRQQVTGSVVDLLADPDLPFFPNPHHRPENLREGLDPVVVPFLDEGLDERHFVDRASGGSLSGELVGFFTGRKEQVERLSEWVDGYGEGRLLTVTGSAGSGKSALLGIVVCAAHHELREATRPLWKRAAAAPYPIPKGLFAAVHARQRGLGEIVASLARQLGLPGCDTAEALRGALPDAGRVPVIVVDALDEAEDGPQVMTELLLPLVRDGRVRLVVGVRDYPEYAALRAAGAVVDLDTVDSGVLEDDLHRYVSDLLRGTDRYRRRGAVVGGFAGALAAALTAERREWGEFLVARIYTRSFAEAGDVADPLEAERLGRDVPLTLPGVFDHDLARSPHLAESLAALAHAYGQGMPESVLARLTGHDRVRQALSEGRFYLRTTVDTDGSTLYRLFHQGLAEYLKGVSGLTPGAVLDRLVADLGEPGERWRAAEPYVLRHAVQHAADAGREQELLSDPGYLTHAPASALESVYDERVLEHLRATADAPEPVRRGVLDLAAVRAGRPPASTSGWRPLWVRPAPEHASRLAGLELWRTHATSSRDEIRAVGVMPVVKAPVVLAADGGGKLWVWDSDLVHELEAHRGAANAIATCVLEGRHVAITAGGDGTMRLWDVAAGTQLGSSMSKYTGPIRALAVGTVAGRPMAAVVAGAHLSLWDLLDRRMTTHVRTSPPETQAVALADVGGQPVVVTVNGDQAYVLRTDGIPYATVADHATVADDGVNAVATTEADGRPCVIVAAGGAIRMYYLPELPLARPSLSCHPGAITAMAVLRGLEYHLLVSGGIDGTLSVVDLDTWSVVVPPVQAHEGGVAAVAATLVGGAPVVVSMGRGREVRVWRLDLGRADPARGAVLVPRGDGWGLVDDGVLVDLDTGAALDTPVPEGWSTAEPVVVGGLPLAALWRGDTAALWDPATGRVLDMEAAALPRRRVLADMALASFPTTLARLRAEEFMWRVSALAVSGLTAFTGGSDGWVRAVRASSMRPGETRYVGDPVLNVLAVPGGRLVVVTVRETICFELGER